MKTYPLFMKRKSIITLDYIVEDLPRSWNVLKGFTAMEEERLLYAVKLGFHCMIEGRNGNNPSRQILWGHSFTGTPI